MSYSSIGVRNTLELQNRNANHWTDFEYQGILRELSHVITLTIKKLHFQIRSC